MKSKEYSPFLAASSMIGHGVSSRSSHSRAGGADDVLGELVDPLLNLELVLVQLERVVGHGAPSLGGPAAAGACLVRSTRRRHDRVACRAASPTRLLVTTAVTYGPVTGPAPLAEYRSDLGFLRAISGGWRCPTACPRPSSPGPPARPAGRRPGRSPWPRGPRRARPPAGPTPRRPRRPPPAATGPAPPASTAAVWARRPPSSSSPASAAEWAAVTSSKMPARAPGVSRSSSMRARNAAERAGVDAGRRRRRPRRRSPRRSRASSSADVEPPGQAVQAVQRLLGVGQRLGRHLDGRAVVGPQHEQPVGAGVAAGQEVGQRGEVAERLRHLGALDLDPAVVHPVPGEGLAVGDGLRPLVLVVRERQVLAAAVQVESLAQQVERHDHALGVPPGPARPPRRRPSWARPPSPSSTGRSRGASASPRWPRPAPRPASDSSDCCGPAGRTRRPGRPRGRRRRASRRPSPGHQLAHQRHHVARCTAVACGMSCGRRSPSASIDSHQRGLELGGHVGLGPPQLGGPLDDVVVDVGDVGHVVHLQPGEAQVAPQDVEGQVGPAVPDVGQVVDRRATDVHRHLALGAELERADRARGGVVKVQHPGTVTRSCRPPRPARPDVPDKPTLDGLEERWAAAWEEAGTYRFDDGRHPRRGLLHRHPPADGVGLAAHGIGLRLRADRRHRPLPAHAGLEALLPDGLGRQRAADRAPGAEPTSA